MATKAVIPASTLKAIQNLLDSTSKEPAAQLQLTAFQRRLQAHLEMEKNPLLAPSSEPPVGAIDLDAAELNEKLASKARSMGKRADLKEQLEIRKSRPIYLKRNEIIQAVRTNQVTVICGELGSGKTSQVPQFLMDEEISSGRGYGFRAIVSLSWTAGSTAAVRSKQAHATAENVCKERCEHLGGKNSTIQSEKRRIKSCDVRQERGSVLFTSTDFLLKLLETDPTLKPFSHIILDEVEIRDTTTDLLLAIFRELLNRCPSLRLILLSNSSDADIYPAYFGSTSVVTIPARNNAPRKLYLEDILRMLDFQFSSRPTGQKRQRREKKITPLEEQYHQLMEPALRQMEVNQTYPPHVIASLRLPQSHEFSSDLILALLKYISTREEDGAILVLLPGCEEVDQIHRILLADEVLSNRDKFIVIPVKIWAVTVHSYMSLRLKTLGVRKIVLTTALGETCIPIDNLVFVIDSGKIKESFYDPKKNHSTEQTNWLSKVNVQRRECRAKWTNRGICYKLYSRQRESTFAARPVPEIQRTRPDELILRSKILKLGKAATFLQRFPEPPEEQTIQLSLDHLVSLGALNHSENLTPLGFFMADMKIEPRVAKLILLGVVFSCLEPILCIAALVSIQDPFVFSFEQREEFCNRKKGLDDGRHSDHLLVAKLLRGYPSMAGEEAMVDYCKENFLDRSIITLMDNKVKDFGQALVERGFIANAVFDCASNFHSTNYHLIRSLVGSVLFPSVAQVMYDPIPAAGAGALEQRPLPLLSTFEDGRVLIHPTSVNHHSRELLSPWLCYLKKAYTSSTFLLDSSEVSSFSLLLFGGNASSVSTPCSGGLNCEVASGINILTNQPTLNVAESLRAQLNEYLSDRVSRPRLIEFYKPFPQKALLRAVIRFVTFGEKKLAPSP